MYSAPKYPTRFRSASRKLSSIGMWHFLAVLDIVLDRGVEIALYDVREESL